MTIHTTPKKDYASTVAERIIELIETGEAIWMKPWKAGELRLPYNAATDKEYRGMNSLWLAMHGYSDPRWITFNQAVAAGYKVKKGSNGALVEYWKFTEERIKKDEHGKPVLGEDGKPIKITVKLSQPRGFRAVVFNAQQIEGIPDLPVPDTGIKPVVNVAADAMIAASGVEIRHVVGNKAFYNPVLDSITLPLRSQFKGNGEFYATTFHELAHSTGHKSRLDRDLTGKFGSETYAKEELRAEIAAMMLAEKLGTDFLPRNHAGYVQSWIKALREDPREIFKAASEADRIKSYLLS
ncbi:ArdC family protein [Brucella thiophenivorans]|uniref:DUF1738 domain-containing protein n=1 Tax=Brucella thiophenivorans TaxID=571255 RepID=A0A256FTU2_9HYPH|nr:zincin-like metallopeptidase domain-containing protein [Brucella thiophenivorans]OYR18243.1 hypothetical protein CEV31_4255 [Brucella thiophenivorans]